MTIEAALTAEEWENFKWIEREDGQFDLTIHIDPPHHVDIYDDFGNYLRVSENLHALAAACLHEQEFGFSWEDVKLLRALAEWCDEFRQSPDEREKNGIRHGTYYHYIGREADHLHSLADRLAALLPPREEER